MLALVFAELLLALVPAVSLLVLAVPAFFVPTLVFVIAVLALAVVSVLVLILVRIRVPLLSAILVLALIEAV